MKLKSIQDIANVGSWEDLRRFTAQFIRDISEVINGNITFGENITSQIIQVSFTGAQTIQVPHSLGRVPTGYLVIGRNANVNIFDGGPSSTTQTLSVQSSGAVNASILVF